MQKSYVDFYANAVNATQNFTDLYLLLGNPAQPERP